MTESTMNKADFYTSIVLLIISLGIIIISIQMPSMTERNESQWSNPGVVPTFIGIALFLLSGSMLLRAIKRGVLKKNENINSDSKNGTISVEEASSISKSPDKNSLFSNPYFRILITIVLCSLYASVLGKIWFPFATFVFIVLFIVVFEFDPKKSLRSQGKKIAMGNGDCSLYICSSHYRIPVSIPRKLTIRSTRCSRVWNYLVRQLFLS